MKQTRLLVNNPREVTYADAFAIYGEALDGKSDGQRRERAGPSRSSEGTQEEVTHEPVREHAGAGRSLGQGHPGAMASASPIRRMPRRLADGVREAFLGSAPNDEGLDEARRAFERSWSAAQELSSSLSNGMQSGQWVCASDPIVAAMLAKIFDPRGWMSATNEVDEALQRMAEGPRLADLWNVERQFAEVFAAWIRLRQRSLEHNKVMLDAWTRAAGAFAKRLNERVENGEPPLDSMRALLTLWGETANEILLRPSGPMPSWIPSVRC